MSGWELPAGRHGAVFDLTWSQAERWHALCGCGVPADARDFLVALYEVHLRPHRFERHYHGSPRVLRLSWSYSVGAGRYDETLRLRAALRGFRWRREPVSMGSLCAVSAVRGSGLHAAAVALLLPEVPAVDFRVAGPRA